MEGERDPAVSNRLIRLAAKFHDKQYRDAYVAARAREMLAKQMREFRGDLSQAEYAEKVGKQKTVVGRLENPGYSGWSLRTMLDIARKEDVAVIAQFVDFSTFLSFTDDMSNDAFHPQGFNETQIDDIAAYLCGTKTYFDLGVSHFIGGTAMGPVLSAPYADMFFGANRGATTLRGTYSHLYTRDIWQPIGWTGHNVAVGQGALSGWLPAESPLPSGVAQTQAAIRWLTDLLILQRDQIRVLESEVESLRQAPPVKIPPFSKHPRRQTFGDPLGALEAA
jgi:hypothetical protein